jgi:CDP-paratose 2-epimerase
MREGRILVTGGAGFIGCHLADRYLSQGRQVTVIDNLERVGAKANVDWLRQRHGDRLDLLVADIAERNWEVERVVASAAVVFHMAAQVAVTASVANPRRDFEVNLLGTLNLLEAARQAKESPILLFASTNKVYGGLEDLHIELGENGYYLPEHPDGISEDEPLDFHSPYVCSKGGADQYMRDYARIFDIPTVVFRQSCIYGTRQFGIEDQGWIAHFAISAILGRPLTIYGDGHQVRDTLYIDDLLDAFGTAAEHIDVTRGRIYNIGGGAAHTASPLSLLQALEEILGKHIEVDYSDWRPGDQKVYISDVRKAQREFGWTPKTDSHAGLERLVEWVQGNQELLRSVGL